MKRRDFLRGGALSAAAASTGTIAYTKTAEATAEKVGIVLVHGSWHGAWCWGMIEPLLNKAGHITVSIDLPGHGLKTQLPSSFLDRPIDLEAFSKEPSYLAKVGIDAYADAVIEGVERAKAKGATRVILVGHSMGGVPITFAAIRKPEQIDGLVYIAAMALSPGNSGGAFLSISDPRPAPADMTTSAFMAIPSTIGALRIDPRSADPEYHKSFKARMAADVPDDLWDMITHMVTPDAPFNFYSLEADFPDSYSRIKRTFVRCTEDYAVNNAMADAMIAAMDAAWPHNPTNILNIQASHEVMFSKPEDTAQAILSAV